RWREEETSALWLAVVLVFVLGWLLTALLWPYEGFTPFLLENERYVVIALVPLAWLALREATDAKGWGALAVILLAASLLTLAAPMRDSEARAAEMLSPMLKPGDRVGVIGMSLYEPYPFLAPRGVALVPPRGMGD